MEAKSHKRNVRVPRVPDQYVTEEGEKIRVLPYNFPRITGKRTHRDADFLKSNDGKLSILQHKIA